MAARSFSPNNSLRRKATRRPCLALHMLCNRVATMFIKYISRRITNSSAAFRLRYNDYIHHAHQHMSNLLNLPVFS